jgi:thiosulfate dehydrogenase (quinone) large subunit
MNPYTYLILRVSVGMSMFGHGLVRLPKLPSFSQWMVSSFQNSMLTEALVRPFSYALPVAEFTTGLLLLLGLFTRQAALAGAAIIICLLFGSSMIEEWGAIPSQLIHGAFFAALLQFSASNRLALDTLLQLRTIRRLA